MEQVLMVYNGMQEQEEAEQDENNDKVTQCCSE